MSRGRCGLSQQKLDEKKWVDDGQLCTAICTDRKPCGDPYSTHHDAAAPTAGGAGPGGDRNERRGSKESESYITFLRGLVSGSVDEKTAKLTLSGDGCIFADPRHGRSLYLRECYAPLAAKIRGSAEPDGKKVEEVDKIKQRIRLTGTPGTGKTCFSLYLIYLLVNAGRVVIWENRSRKMQYRLSLASDGLPAIDHADIVADRFARDLRQTATWYIIDGANGDLQDVITQVDAITIFVTSPRPNAGTEFLKSGYSLYMPVWEWKEIEQCRLLVFSTSDKREVLERFSKWGGIPRYVLYNTEEDSQKRLDKAISACVLKQVVRAAGTIAGPSDLSQHIIHLRVDSDFRELGVTFASPWVQRQVVKALTAEQKDDTKAWLAAAKSMSEMGGLRGNVFEGYAHNLLAGGGEFQIRCIEPGDTRTSTLTLPKSREGLFTGLDEIADTSDIYQHPAWPTLTSVDGLSQPNRLFQLTISLRHAPLSVEGLDDIRAKMTDGKTCILFIVAPTDTYSKIRKQSYKHKKERKEGKEEKKKTKTATKKRKMADGSDEKKKKKPKVAVPWIEQWALHIPISLPWLDDADESGDDSSSDDDTD